MIFLDESLYINKGTNRVCYVHPNDKTKCLKIDLKDSKETKRELKYYKQLIKKIFLLILFQSIMVKFKRI